MVSDLREGKITLPLIYVLDVCTPEEARKIETVLQEKDFKSVTRAEIISLIQKYRTLEKTRSLAESFAREAQEALHLFAPSAYRDALHSIPRIILEREK